VLRNHTLLADGEPSTYSMTFEVTGGFTSDGDLEYAEI